MSRLVWRWEEKDFGFRFRPRGGRHVEEYYQARMPGEYYVVPAQHRKFSSGQANELAGRVQGVPSPRVVANPWRDYHREWDWIVTEDGISLNWAGCLDKSEIDRREDEGVQRSMELVAALVERQQPVPLTIDLIKQIHVELMGTIYPFAGEWRTVSLHKGEGPTKWPLPIGGIRPLMDVLERDVLSRSPFIHADDDSVFTYASEVMNEVLGIHPFREGNGRTAFIVGNLILMQNEMLPLTTYERRADEERYYDACERGRIQRDYQQLARLLAEWEDGAISDWRNSHGS